MVRSTGANLMNSASRSASCPCFVLTALAVAIVTASAVAMANPAPAMAEGRRPTMQDVKAIIQRHLSNKPNYRRGDLIVREDVEPIFNDLLELGIKPFDNQEELYDSFLPSVAFLAQTLRTPAGRTFMRQVYRLPGAYDRLERLAWLPKGKALLQQLVLNADGPEQFQSLTTTDGMQRVAKLLADDPRGSNFSLPTGHIHTEDQLLRRLETISAKQGIR